MIRGGPASTLAIMGGLEVDEQANLANWAVPGQPLLGVGGAMDPGGGRQTVDHHHAAHQSRRQRQDRAGVHATLTAHGVVDMVITDLAVFTFGMAGSPCANSCPARRSTTTRARPQAVSPSG